MASNGVVRGIQGRKTWEKSQCYLNVSIHEDHVSIQCSNAAKIWNILICIDTTCRLSIHKPLYRYRTSCIDTGPCQDQNLHSVKNCIDTHQHVSIQWFIVSIHWSLYRYNVHCIDTNKVFGPNVSIHYAMYRYMQVIFTVWAILTRPTLIRNSILTHFFASWKIKTHSWSRI